MQRKEIHLTDEELKAIWKGAQNNKHDFYGFQAIFSEGLYRGIQKIQNDKGVVHEELYLAARNGDYDKFKRLFETRLVQVDDHINGKTFLYAVIKSDTQSENDPATIGRKEIAKYLLENGADINMQSWGLADPKPSPRELYEYQKKSNSNTWFNYIFSTFRSMPQYGKNIFPILKDHCDKISQQKTSSVLKN
jgi:hypothetical protein